MEQLVNALVEARKTYGMFSLERVAAETGVTVNTVRNFENQSCISPKVLVYYLGTVLYELREHQFHYAYTQECSELQIEADRQEIVTLLETAFVGRRI